MPAIVLMHDALEDPSIWHGVIPWLQPDGYQVRVLSKPLRGLANEEQARDLVRETFLAALERVDKFEGKSSERT